MVDHGSPPHYEFIALSNVLPPAIGVVRLIVMSVSACCKYDEQNVRQRLGRRPSAKAGARSDGTMRLGIERDRHGALMNQSHAQCSASIANKLCRYRTKSRAALIRQRLFVGAIGQRVTYHPQCFIGLVDIDRGETVPGKPRLASRLPK